MTKFEMMEIIEERTVKTSKELKKIINQLGFIKQEEHDLSKMEIAVLKDAYDILMQLEENLYFNNPNRMNRF